MRDIMRFLAGVMLGAALLVPLAANAQTLQTFAFPSGASADPAPQGARSFAGLIWEGGFLYGTTSSGANIYTTSPNGCGSSPRRANARQSIVSARLSVVRAAVIRWPG
jgi:hypothetical protein